MTVLRRPFERARRLARDLLWECGVDEPSKIDPFVLVGRKQIKVTYGRLDGASARIFRHGDRAIIRVSDQIVQVGRLRFTIAHEVAHFLLEHRIPSELVLDADAPAPFSVHQEREADVFAAEYLMPSMWVAPLCASKPVGFDAVHEIVSTFRTSVVASSVRYVELTSTPCAVVYSEQGHVVWAKRSRTFPGRIPSQLKIAAGAVAVDYFEKSVLDAVPRVVPATAWCGTHSPNRFDGLLVEQAMLVPEPGWGGVLSLIKIASGGSAPQQADLSS